MKQAITREDAIPLAQKLAGDLEAAYEEITALDAAMGDGDLGVTCRLGMTAVCDGLAELADAPVGQVLIKSGMTFNSAGASTYGALVATAGMRAGKYAEDSGVQTWDLQGIIGAAVAAAEGIEARGKASRGDKTLLDALWPAIDALRDAQDQDKSLADALADAASAAQHGAQATRPLKAKFGRAAWLQEKTVGLQDPGATVVAIVMRSVAEYAAES